MPFRTNNLFLSVFSGLLLAVSWYWHLTILVFFAFVPLLMLEDNLTKSNDPKRKLKLFFLSYLTFLIFNLGVTWWVVYASFGGAVMAFIFNTLFMAMVFAIFSNFKKVFNKAWGIWLLVPLWIAYEYGHSSWDLAWIWLTLGNVFAFNHNWVQWYEFTGTSGGTLWVLTVNILVFQVLTNYQKLKFLSTPVLKIAGAIIVPVLFSYTIALIREPLQTKTKPASTIVVQPNMDPYNDKFVLDYELQFSRLLKLISGKVTSETDYLVLPETFIVDNINEELLDEAEPLTLFYDSILRKFPDLKIVVGASSYLFYRDKKDVTVTARKHESGEYFDFFNTALQLDLKGRQLYHKSKLVPGAELMPFPGLLKPLESLALDMGGTTGSLGLQKERTVFKDAKSNMGVAPVICYESVFSDYITEYIRNGATFIFIITNDGWWDDTPGYKQHLNYARLRAIENRRQIARSANTGVSCFIDEFGNISNATKWWEEAVIEKNIYPNNELTFFSRFGDLISYISIGVSFIIIVLFLIYRVKK